MAHLAPSAPDAALAPSRAGIAVDRCNACERRNAPSAHAPDFGQINQQCAGQNRTNSGHGEENVTGLRGFIIKRGVDLAFNDSP